MKPPAINLKDKLSKIDEFWSPRIIGEANGQLVKLARLQGEFIEHNHAEEDEIFIVIRGTLYLELPDAVVTLNEGDMYIVPRAVQHRPYTGADGADVLLIEPKSTKHTGDVIGPMTNNNQKWL